MSKTVFINRSGSGSGCGCFILIVLLIVIIIRALWYLLPYLIVAYLLWQAWLYLSASKEGAGRSQEKVTDQHDQFKQTIVRDNHGRHIKEAEVIEDDEDK